MRPNHMAVYLSNRCNLACKYCYVAVNQGEPVQLSFEHLKHDVDYFFQHVDAPDKKITFLGGEPFLYYPLMQRVVDYIRSVDGGRTVLQTYTNGVNLTQEMLDWLGERHVFVTLSLDGTKETNDRNRVFYAPKAGHPNEDRSVFDEVMARLDKVSKKDLGVSLTFDSRSVGDLLKNVDFFYRMGFSRITFNPELYELWPEEKLKTLATVMKGFARYYTKILTGGMRPFTVPILFSVLETQRAGPGWWHECHNVVLGADDKFYSCDKPLTFTFDKIESGQCGDAAAGMDWDKRGEDLRGAREVVEAAVGGDHRQYFCPMGVVFASRFSGAPPEAMVENFTKVSDIFGGILEKMVEELRPTPAFRALYEDVHLV